MRRPFFCVTKEEPFAMNPTRLHPECMKCLINKYMLVAPEGTPRATEMAYVHRFLSILAAASDECSAPVLLRQINDLRYELYGQQEDFGDIKRRFNALMLTQEGWMNEQIETADDPLLCAVRFAMIGNYIDFGAQNRVDEDQLRALLSDPDLIALHLKALEDFRQEVRTMKRMVYLTDNCGEIVADKLLIRAIRRLNPSAEIVAIVRGMDVLNDATMEDANQVRLADEARVIGNGTRIAGTWLPAISPEALTLIEGADVIVSKGQANFETLCSCGLNVYYLFLCKCDLFAKRFDVPKLTGLMLRDRELGEFERRILPDLSE